MHFELTAEQVCEKYNIKESYLKNQFKQFQNSLQKKNILVTKYKNEKKETIYVINQEYSNKVQDFFYIDAKVLKDQENLACNILITLSSLEHNAYGGRIEEFMNNYLNLPYNQNQKEKFLNMIGKLKEEDYIMLDRDALTKGNILIGLEPKMRDEFKFKIFVMQLSKELANKYNKKSYIPIFKLIVALRLLGGQEVIKYGDIRSITGLSDYYIKDGLEMLRDNNLVYIGRLRYKIEGSEIRCVGRDMCLNGIYLRDDTCFA